MSAGFQCEACGSRETGTTDTRAAEDGMTRRRRECECGHRFTTYEISADAFEQLQMLRSGKLRAMLQSALEVIPS